MDELLPPDPAKLLATWMEWEKGTSLPGRVIADLKKGGLRELLEAIVAAATVGAESGEAKPQG